MLYPYPLKDTKKGTKDIVNKDIILTLLKKKSYSLVPKAPEARYFVSIFYPKPQGL